MNTLDSTRADGMSAEGTPQSPLKIFLNYRHDDMPFAAMMLYRELTGRFGAENIFFDNGTLRAGMRFPEEIRSHLTNGAGAFIAMIGSKWMSAITAHRQHGDLDYVAKEIELALQNRWTVIPLLVDDATLPDPTLLPPAIRALPDCQVARFRQTSLDDDVKDLSTRLNEIHASMTSTGRTPVRPLRPQPAAEPAPEVLLTEAAPEVLLTEAAPEAPPVNDKHYQMLFDEADNLVIFLGAEVNADDHDGPFREGAAMLPDDRDLAAYLAAKIKLESGPRDLAEVAQYVRIIRGEPNVFRWVSQVLTVDSQPGPVHRYLAGLPRRLEELGLQKRYQMIVTPTLDLALEQAFREAGEPFDVAVYMAPGTEYAGNFVHLPWGSADPQAILKPNEYKEFPIDADYGELTRTVIVRISGAVDHRETGYRWKSNFVITEDHYIDYPRGRPAEQVVPSQILAKLRQASCLFLGYTIADWRLRVFLHWIWQGESFGGATHWAVERDPDVIEQQFWQRSGVALYKSRLTDYVREFDRFLALSASAS